MVAGLSESVFILTDFSREVQVKYTGSTSLEFKEGEIIVLTAYIPDLRRRTKLVALDYMTKHSLEAENWEGILTIFIQGQHWVFWVLRKKIKEKSKGTSLG